MLMTRVYRRLVRQLLLSTVLIAMLATAAIPTGLSLVSGSLSTEETAISLGFIVFGVAGFWIGLRTPFLTIVAKEEHVRVVSYLRSREMPWTEVLRIEEPPVYGLLGSGIKFILTDGGVIADDAFSRSPVESSKDTARAMQELEQLRQAAWQRHGLQQGPDPSSRGEGSPRR
jgi:hypothetical protein